MSSQTTSFRTKLLSARTWPDFERLFSGGNGWDFCWCMAMQRDRPTGVKCETRAEQGALNHEQKRDLLRAHRAHGVLVYADGEPVGWCQYGPPSELPVLDRPRGRFAKPRDTGLPPEDWRITCFVVAKKWRRKGVATTALRAALAAIGRRGGGIVEAYPLDPATADTWGPGTRVDYGHFGTVSMFEAAGFTRVGWLKPSNAIMRRTL
jgi:GNAT superfamily N-acetyltransferase